jgi:hypothetical protein
MRVVLWDEFDVAPDVDRAPRMYCDECRKRVPYRYDQFGYRECLECNADETALAALEV